MPNSGEKAPDFTLPSTRGDGSFTLSRELGKRGLLLAFFPFDFSPVCTNELGYLNTNLKRFREKKVSLAAVSVDSIFAHRAWAKIGKFRFPLLADFNREVCRRYGVLYDDFDGLREFAKRAIFLIDHSLTVRYRWVSEDPSREPDYKRIFAVIEEL